MTVASMFLTRCWSSSVRKCWRSAFFFRSSAAFHSSVMSREIESRCDGLPSSSLMGETWTSQYRALPFAVLAAPRNRAVLPALALATADDRLRVSFAGPELRPRAAFQRAEIVDLHHALAALAHEDETAFQIEDLDAIAAAGEDTSQEVGIVDKVRAGVPQFSAQSLDGR